MKPRMRLFQRKNGVWYVEIERGKNRTLKTKDPVIARQKFKAMQKAALKGKLAEISGESKASLKDFRVKFVEWSENVQTHSTFRGNRLALDKLMEFAGGGTKLSRLSEWHIDQVISQESKKNRSINSINNFVRHIRSVFNKAVTWSYLKTNPFRNIKELSADKRRPDFLSQDEIKRYLASIKDKDLRALVAAYLATGRRRSELLSLNWEDVEWERRRYYVRKAKRNLSRYYPLSKTFETILKGVGKKDEGRIFNRWAHPDTVSHLVKESLVKAGLGHLRLHDLRHTFASTFVSAGGNLRHLQDLLGHTEYRTTEIYAHVAEEQMSEEIERVRLGPIDLG